MQTDSYCYTSAWSQGQYQWPRTPEAVRELTCQQLRWLQDGLKIDQPKAHRPVTGIEDV